MPDTSTSDPVVVREQRGAVLVLRLNRPDARNALNPALIGELGAGLAAAEDDPDTRAVVLGSTGDRAFCAGMDLREFSEGTSSSLTPEQESGTPTFGRFMSGDYPVPVVGAANATAVAGGFELLLCCDLVVASQDAMFGLPEVKRALFPAGGGIFLGTRIPLAVALEMTLTGDSIDAARAAALGLVNRVVPAAEVLDAAVALAERIAANGPLGLAATKELVRLAVTNADEARDKQNEWMPRIFGSDDAREGATAFIEKREPRWQGR